MTSTALVRAKSASKGTKSGRRRGQLPWAKSPATLGQIEQVIELSLAGMSVQEVADELHLSRMTVYRDLKRSRELTKDRVLGSITESVSKLRWGQEKARQALERVEQSGRPYAMVIPALLGEHRQATMSEAKLLGQEPRQRAEFEVTLRNGDRDLDRELEELIARRFGAVAKPRLLVEGKAALEAPGEDGATPA